MRHWWALALVWGCESAPKHAKPAIVDDLPTDTGPDTVHDGFQPYAFGVVEARFAVDAERRAVGITAVEDGVLVELPVSVTVLITDADGAQTGAFTDDNHCTVVLEHPGPLPEAPWAADASAWFAFALDGATGTTDCGRLDFPPAWGDHPVAHVTKWIWGAGVGPITQETTDLLGASYPPLADWLVGGGYHWEDLAAFPGSENQADYADCYLDVGYALAWQVQDGALVTDPSGERVPLPVDAVAADVSAWYEVQTLRLLTPAGVLLDDPG